MIIHCNPVFQSVREFGNRRCHATVLDSNNLTLFKPLESPLENQYNTS